MSLDALADLSNVGSLAAFAIFCGLSGTVYLVNDVPDAGTLPDMLYLSTGGQAGVTVATDAAFGGGGLKRIFLRADEAGQIEIEAKLRRPWEHSQPPIRQANFKVSAS